MSMVKFAKTNLDIIDVFSNPDEMRVESSSGEQSKVAVAQFRETIRVAKGKLKKSEDFAYIRTRAIGSMEKWGPNGNGDGFPLKELQASYKTFIGKGNFIDHHSDDITKIRGLVVDAFMNNEDESVECLIAVDKKSHPQLARDIETGVVNSVSMGTRVGFSNCSVCKHAARTEDEYCDHVRNYKGMKIGWLTNNDAHRNGAWPVHEVNHDLEFIELSWVSVPAFKEANVLERLASLRKAVSEQKDNNNDRLSSAIQEGIVSSENSVFNNELRNFAKSETERDIIELAKMGLRSRVYDNTRKSSSESAQRYQGDGTVRIDQNDVDELKANLAAAECRDTECAFDARKSNTNHVKETTAMQRIKIDIKELTLRKSSKDFAAKGSVSIDGKDYDWKSVSGDKKEWHVSFDLDVLDAFSSAGIDQIIIAVKELLNKNVDSTELVVANAKPNVRTAYLENQNEDPNMSEYIDDRYKDSKPSDDMIYPNKNLEVPGVGNVMEAEYKAYSQTAKEGPAGELGKTEVVTENSSKKEIEYKTELQRAFMKYKFIKTAAEDDESIKGTSKRKKIGKYIYLGTGENNKLNFLDEKYHISADEIVDLYIGDESSRFEKGTKKDWNEIGGQIIDVLDKIYEVKQKLNNDQIYWYPEGGSPSKAEEERESIAQNLEVEKDSLIDKLDEIKNTDEMKDILKALQKYSDYAEAFSETSGIEAPQNIPNFDGELESEEDMQEEMSKAKKAAEKSGEEFDEEDFIRNYNQGIEDSSEEDLDYDEFFEKIMAAASPEAAEEIWQNEITPAQAVGMPKPMMKQIQKRMQGLLDQGKISEREKASIFTPELAAQYESKTKERDELVRSLDQQLLDAGVKNERERKKRIQRFLDGEGGGMNIDMSPARGGRSVDLGEVEEPAGPSVTKQIKQKFSPTGLHEEEIEDVEVGEDEDEDDD